MTDYIDRQAAIRWIKTECNPYGKPTIDYESGVKVIDHIETMPSAEVEPVKRGRWIKNEDRHGWHCSCCNVDNYYAYSWNNETGMNEFQDNYCPNCGAKMDAKGENE